MYNIFIIIINLIDTYPVHEQNKAHHINIGKGRLNKQSVKMQIIMQITRLML